ncbi:MAG: hypothetical protein EPO51_20745 [Phenylobacterium sp.]|uniref:terminase small subunit-like protein n=1 Tax=Phenylobacterium sp. TaxID=1871053 RepID=UPI0011FFECA9|nr:hypothetical protein [Phenylobacterium sp.]TAJ69952.1 MAG: hypothetical protein EPO51_20745 [Phenylobacterium sp.]
MGKGRAAGRKLQVFYSEELAAEICAELAAGWSMRSICAKPGRPHAGTVRNWEMRHPEFEMAVRAAYRQVTIGQRRRDREAAAELAARPAPVRGGKTSTYTRAVGEAICERLAEGESLTSIGKDPAMPCYGTILAWVKRHPKFEDMYVLAREIQGHYLFDEMRDVALAATKDTLPVDRFRFDVNRYQASRLAPKKYLERLVAAEEMAELGIGPRGGVSRGRGRDGDDARRVVFHVTHFEKGPNGTVLAAPPRNAREAQAWIEATGAPYVDGIGPNGQMRPPMIPLSDR